MSIGDRDPSGYSSEVRLFVELDNGDRIPVAQMGANFFIVRDYEGELPVGQFSKLIVIVDDRYREMDVVLSSHDRESGIVEFW